MNEIETQAYVIHTISIISFKNADSKYPRSIPLRYKSETAFMKISNNFRDVTKFLWKVTVPFKNIPQSMKGNNNCRSLSVKIVNALFFVWIWILPYSQTRARKKTTKQKQKKKRKPQQLFYSHFLILFMFSKFLRTLLHCKLLSLAPFHVLLWGSDTPCRFILGTYWNYWILG